ncbi:Peroxisome proliferator-activated receptor gamma coactivator-related protein 1 PGC-1-related coactivator [Collichthys lucidus]|uniref:Peroxisome proliferator-activated receptor gamma coactivator-related protein 1 PGC-1-related coactivator n=1 Tax=Collichthys lucidus TaxID=240159 RepID=A0A4V6AN07_COLLU|nr:Peroxisome proliferator-activated receptor gamma coactivator-related protein 1 PGC-1-related coactivator [Collichthys lucidus]
MRGEKGGGSSQLHWYEYDAEAAARATSPLSSPPLQPHPSIPTKREEERERGHCIHGNGRAATKGLDGESEATLLTALTEILDNVDDENLSPFDTLPDSDLLSGQKGRDHSPLRRLLCLPRSPPEKDALCSTRPISAGKSLPRMHADSLQRSDGEEEEDGSLTSSPVGHDSSLDNDLLDWKDLTLPLPVSFEQEGEDGVSFSLGDLVRHMHPYCVTICVENDEGEQMLPEGGILLEVVDQGENGEPILAIPDMDLPAAVPHHEVSNEAEDVASDTSEHIVVDGDDDVTVSAAPVKVAPPVTPDLSSDIKDEMIIKRQKEEIKAKSPSRRRKRRRKARNSPNLWRKGSCGVEKQKMTPLNASPEKTLPRCSPTSLSSQQPLEMSKQPAGERLEGSSAALSAVLPPVSSESPAAAPTPVTPQATPPVSEALPPVAPAVSEAKPKSLSLAEYRRLRQQKKPAPLENQDNGNSTKWPSLPELPKELPPIPCLPDPCPKDPRRPNPQVAKKELEEIRPAWQPRGPCAPPTPEALLVPPAYMVASSSKVLLRLLPLNPSKHLNPPNLHYPKSPHCPPPVQWSVYPHIHTPLQCLAIKPTAATASPPSAPQKITAFPKVPVVTAPTLNNPVASDSKLSKLTASGTSVASATHPSDSESLKAKPVVLEIKEKPTTAKSPTQELIEAFTSEIGIEAADLTSLLEQFEETQAKEEQCVPEVSGRAAAVGNSSAELAPEKTVVERVRANDLSSTAALTPPATPPHQMWKPLAPVALLGKSKAAEASKSSPSKVIQIEARPLPSVKSRSKPTPVAPVAPEVACMDHDYCLPNKGSGEPGKRWNVKQQSFITIKPIKSTATTTQTPPSVQSTTNAVYNQNSRYSTDGAAGSQD